MKCTKHARDMKWIGSLAKGGLVCEDCEFESESVQMRVGDEDDGKGPCSANYNGGVPAKSIGQPAPTPPPAPVAGNVYVTISGADFVQVFSRKHLCIPNGYVDLPPIPANSVLAARYRAGQYYTLLVNSEPTCAVVCPYCGLPFKIGMAHRSACSDHYYADINTGLIK